jgi:NAD(P)-dependent dehydrogenase (short-subunit alcohol dehydrogenase family)
VKPVKDRVILVTGATDGIGKAAAHILAGMGATVLLHGRNRKKGDAVVKEIRRASANDRLRYYAADFASLAEVRRLAAEVNADCEKLDVLINNAGAGPGAGKNTGRQRALSRDGHELLLAVNYLAPFLLTRLLLPALQRAAPSRIVNVTSAAQRTIDFSDVMLEHRYDGMTAYAQSKLALAAFTFELAQRLNPRETTVNCLHPGSLLDTKMVREHFANPLGSAQSGAQIEVYLATAPELQGQTGRYFEEMHAARAAAQAYDEDTRKKLWQLAEELTGLRRQGRQRQD